MDWLRRFLEKKSGFPKRECQVLDTHLNRIRNFGGNFDSVSPPSAQAKRLTFLSTSVISLFCSVL
jgi:hypothetical protein